jgi:hypothetical protein
MVHARLLTFIVVLVACVGLAADAAAARYPANARVSFHTNCVATAALSLKTRHVSGASARASRYCDCMIVRLEARMPFAAFKKYDANIIAGRAQNPASVKLLHDSMLACIGVALK